MQSAIVQLAVWHSHAPPVDWPTDPEPASLHSPSLCSSLLSAIIIVATVLHAHDPEILVCCRKEGRFTHPWQRAKLIGWNSVWVGQCCSMNLLGTLSAHTTDHQTCPCLHYLHTGTSKCEQVSKMLQCSAIADAFLLIPSSCLRAKGCSAARTVQQHTQPRGH